MGTNESSSVVSLQGAVNPNTPKAYKPQTAHLGSLVFWAHEVPEARTEDVEDTIGAKIISSTS